MATGKELERVRKLLDNITDHYSVGCLENCVFLSTAESIHYFTGFRCHEGSVFALIPFWGEQKPVVVTDARYKDKASREMDLGSFDLLIAESVDYITTLFEHFKQNRYEMPRSIFFEGGYENEGLRVKQKNILKDVFRISCFKDVTNEILKTRSIKDEEEVTLTKKAISISETALDIVLNFVRPGVRESEIAGMISFEHKKQGADGDSFEPIVASGINSSFPHGGENRVIQFGDIVQFDIGCSYKGYCSDISRAFVVRERPGGDQFKLCSIVKEIQEKIISKIKPGVDLFKVNQWYGQLVRDKGYRMAHSFGHGVGLQVHEYPTIASQSSCIAEPGQIITVEPGIYIKDEFGVRIEDMVLVTENGLEVLTSLERILAVV
ncbi:MAG: Xaa-Pro peptidase family protein [Candidatus Marinimicrobia bacterium]|nr:Xaa-Pro peptidase family protein [Candidatus Neomarinimicrobiota bacterium]